jgi:hypothetical protein
MADTQQTGTRIPLNIAKWIIGFLVVIAVEVVVISFLLGEGGKSSVTSGALFAVLAGSALGIERIIELGWTAVSLGVGAWWPITNVSNNVNELVNSFTSAIKPFYDQAETLIEKMRNGNDEAKARAAQADEVLAKIKEEIGNLQGMSLPQFHVLISAIGARTSQLQVLVKEAGELSPLVDQTLDVISSLVGSFKDNPGRRLISLFVGIIIGLPVAAAIGLDIFQVPATEVATTEANEISYTTIGVIVSGLVIGLGSNPTHEVIKLVQEAKRKFKGDNKPASEDK